MSSGSFMKRLEKLEQAINLKQPRFLVVVATEADRAAKLAAIQPPITDADLVVIVRAPTTASDEPELPDAA